MAGPFLVSALLALGMAQGGQSIQTDLAWHGLVAADAYTELALEVTSPGHPSVTVELIAPDLVIKTVFELDQSAFANGTLPVPVRQFHDTALRIKAGNSPWEVLDIGEIVQSRGGIVIAGNQAARALTDYPGTTLVSVQELPTIPAAYSHIRALALGGDELSQISASQLHALLEYIGMCGRIMLVDAPAEFTQLLQQRAACGQRFFVATGADGNPAANFAILLQGGTNRLPNERTLQRLLDNRGRDVNSIALFLGGFLLLFMVLSSMRDSRGAALALSVTLTLFAGFFWSNASRHSFVARAETSTSENVARFAAIERVSSTGRGAQVFSPDSLARSITNITGTDFVLSWSDRREDRYIDWSPSLLQEMQLLSIGNFAVESRLRVEARDTGLTVCNRSIASTPAAFVRWEQNNYAVPALAPGETLQLDDSNLTSDNASHLRLLANRANDSHPSILQPLTIPGNRTNQAAWLMTIETAAGSATCHA